MRKWLRTRVVGLLTTLVLAGSVLPAQETPAPANKVNGLEIYLDQGPDVESRPAVEVDARERYVTLRAKPIGEGKIERVEWLVVTVGAVPVKTTEDLDPSNLAIIVGLPEADEGLLVYANALVTRDGKPAITKHALLSVRVVGKAKVGGPVGPAPAAVGTPVAIPANVTGLSVVLASRDVPPKELADLVGSATVKAELAKSKSSVYLYGPDQIAKRADRDFIMGALKDSQGKDINIGVLVIGPANAEGKASLLTGRAVRLVYLKYDGRTDAESLRKNELILLDTVGRAAGGK